MPCISDPGYVLVKKARERNLPVTVLPGASAGLCALVLSGFKCDRFVFEGFLPRQSKERKARIEALRNEERAVILHESPHHLEKTLEELSLALNNRMIAIAREITKIHEECIIFPLNEWKENLPTIKGEFVLVLSEKENTNEEFEDIPLKEQVRLLMDSGISKKDAIKQVAQRMNVPKNDVYMEAVDL
jgi:16S rRNA (cytidine1402-2'-O)-methyltransferase